jgi:hypothetical protein
VLGQQSAQLGACSFGDLYHELLPAFRVQPWASSAAAPSV